MSTLHLTLKKKWFEMILSGEKKEEYREIKPYWEKRFNPTYTDYAIGNSPKSTIYNTFYIRRDLGGVVYDKVEFQNGYSKNAPKILIECKGILTGNAKADWSDNWQGCVFIIKLGNIIETANCEAFYN